MMSSLCLASLAGLLVIGALIDIESRRLPNWLTSAVAVLYGLFVVVSPTPIAWTTGFAVASLVFAVGFVCFAFQLIGGGDVKLLAGLSLWAGADHIVLFLIATSLAGGLLAAAMVIFRYRAESAPVLYLLCFSSLIAKKFARMDAVAGGSSSTPLTDAQPDISLPYGVAIAAGGFAIIYALLQL